MGCATSVVVAARKKTGKSPMHKSSSRWALILAAGSGTRLSGLTADGTGVSVPKQFCSLVGGASLLEETVARAAAIASPERTAIVVAAEHRRFWQGALAHVADHNVLVQPRNRGTANGILLGISAILERDAGAIVAILASDHYVEREDVMEQALERAVAAVEASPEQSITFLGISPDNADPELGYIVPGARRRDGSRRIARFVEKPARAIAARMVKSERALWNSFILVARASALAELIERRFPIEVAAFRSVFRQTALTERLPRELARLYERLPEIDFSRGVVEGADVPLSVLAVPHCGWSDLGTPQRVADTLSRLRGGPALESNSDCGERTSRFQRHFNLAEAHARLIGRAPLAAAQTA
jgi:mannose-1-phosphate guanylyltransferase